MIPFATALLLTSNLTPPPAGVVGSWLDPNDRTSTITLSPDRLTAQKNATASVANIVGRHGKVTGKWRFSVVFSNVSAGEVSVGVGGIFFNRSTYPGASGGESIAWTNSGTRPYNNAPTGTFSAYTSGDILDFYINADTKQLWMAKNGVIAGGGSPETGTGGYTMTSMTKAIYPLAYLHQADSAVTFNFAGPFTYNTGSTFAAWNNVTASNRDNFRSMLINIRDLGYYAHAFSEIALRTTSGGTNLLLGGGASAQATVSGSPASNGIDGSGVTYWAGQTSTTQQNQGPLWYRVDMGTMALRSARFIAIQSRGAAAGENLQVPTLFDLAFSADGVSFDKAAYGMTFPSFALGETKELAIPEDI